MTCGVYYASTAFNLKTAAIHDRQKRAAIEVAASLQNKPPK
jgi:hypothetical protein